MVHLSGTYLKFLLMLLVNMAFCQTKLIVTSDQSAREGDAEVVIPCNFSQFTDTLDFIEWREVDEAGTFITESIVHDKGTEKGRYSLRTESGNADLIISEPMRNDSQRRFQCKIRFSVGDPKFSSVSILTVYYLDDPVLKGPHSIIYEGDPVTLTCIIPDGDPTPDVTWYKDGKSLRKKDVTTNKTMSALHIKQSSVDDKGSYICKAESNKFEGSEGKTSDVYQLILNYISIEFKTEDKFVTCTAKGNPKPINVAIMQDGEVIKNGKDRAMVEINDEICKSNLTCYAENGEINKTEALKTCEVSDDPLISRLNNIIYVGDTVTLTCSIPDGDPVPYITWYKSGNSLSYKDVMTNKTLSVLYIKSATLDDDGVYTCKAESDQFKDASGKEAVYHLRLHYLKVTFKSEDDKTICWAEGYPEPTFVKISKDGNMVGTGEYKAVVNNEVCQSTFTCYAENGDLNVTDSHTIPEYTKCKTSDVGHIVTATVGTMIGSLLTFLVLRFLHKRQMREIHLHYQDQIPQYQTLDFPASDAENNQAEKLQGNTVFIANDTRAEVNSMYGDLPN